MDNNEKPAINIYFSSYIKDKSPYNQILWGIEEEGIPYNVESLPLENPVELGYVAAENSKLNVGIGIGKNGNVVVHYSNLNKDEPLFKLDIRDNYHNLRKIGANSARLIKGIPFKTLTDTYEEEQSNLKNDLNNQINIEAIVREIINSLHKKEV